MGYASDVVRFDDWDSGKLGMESLDVGQLLRDVAFEESNVRRVGEAAESVRESGWDWEAAKDFVFGGGAVGLMAIGYVPSSFLKAGKGAARALGMLANYDAAPRMVAAGDVSAVRRALGRRRIAVSDEDLAAGANKSLEKLGFRGAEKPDGGFTWNPRSNQFDFSEGYISGISPLHTRVIPIEEFTAKDVVDFLDYQGYGSKKVSQLLAEDPTKMVGGWVEDGEVYLDVSKVFDNKDEAVAVGTRLGELAIWDAAKGESIYTDAAKIPTPFARAALAGGAEIDSGLLKEIDDAGLSRFFTGKIEGGELRPELTPIFFGDMTTGQKQWLAKELAKETPKRVFTADDFKNDIVRQWMDNERAYLKGLSSSARSRLGKKTVDGKLVADRSTAPLVSFFEEMGLSQVPRSSRMSAGMHRKITKSILDGDLDTVAEVLAAQSNNLARFVSADALTPNFYPYMAFMTLTGSKNIHATALAPILAASSAQVGPGGEAGRALRAAAKLKKNRWVDDEGVARPLYRIEDGRAVWTGSSGSGYDVNTMKVMVELANNPDWMMLDLPGISVKTYVYGLLKLNPRLSRALVVDTVDIQMRFATKMSPGWDTTKAGEMTEIAMNQFATRAMASMMDAPVFGVQENGWALFRSIRDRFAGTPKSLTYKRMPLRDVYRQIGMPDDLGALYQKNYAKLLEDVRSGRVEHWQEITKGVLVPADNMPVEYLLPPAIRSKPGYVERFKDMISSAEELGRMLRRD